MGYREDLLRTPPLRPCKALGKFHGHAGGGAPIFLVPSIHQGKAVLHVVRDLEIGRYERDHQPNWIAEIPLGQLRRIGTHASFELKVLTIDDKLTIWVERPDPWKDLCADIYALKIRQSYNERDKKRDIQKIKTWEEARQLRLFRDGEEIEPGVIFFILMLEKLYCRTIYSCESHSEKKMRKFYIMFQGTYEMAHDISSLLYRRAFRVYIPSTKYSKETWVLERIFSKEDDREKDINWAANQLVKQYGEIDFDPAEES